MRRFVPLVCTSVALVAASVLVAVPSVRAAEAFDSCTGMIESLPTVIGTQGVWCLDGDLATGIGSGKAIDITVNNVTIDCNGFKLGGLAAGSGTETMGISATGRRNLTVRNCNIRGFNTGVSFYTSTGTLVEDNLFEGNTYAAMYVGGDGTTIRRNRIFDTGGSTAGSSNTAYGVYTSGVADILDNSISGNHNQYAYGVYVVGDVGGVIGGNRIRGLAADFSAYGIVSDTATRVTIRDNVVAGPGNTGIKCASNLGTSTRNLVGGFDFEVSGCTSSGDLPNNN